MITSFWSGIAGKLAERWAAALFSPAFVFWATGAAAWLVTRRDAADRQRLLNGVAQLSGFWQAVILVGALLLIAASAVVVERCSFAVIRLLEGYWPAWLGPVHRRITKRRARRKTVDEERWGQLQGKWERDETTPEEIAELLSLEQRLSEAPADERQLMPTRVGNVLRAAESRPYEKYGLEAVRCWPRLWLVLPDSTKQELAASRASLDTAATWWTWAALVVIWTMFTPVAVAVAVVAVWFTYWSVVGAARRYGELLDAAFDIHRGLLYDALGQPRPDGSRPERPAGEALSQLILRGPDMAPTNAHPPATDAGEVERGIPVGGGERM